MRESDRIKSGGNLIERLHDKQIYDTKHDKIVKWLNFALSKNVYSSSHHIWQTSLGDGWGDWNLKEYKVYIEHPIYAWDDTRCQYSDRILGFADLAIKVKLETGHGTYSGWRYIEVKSRVNLGETIRQIKYYCEGNPQLLKLWRVCAPACDDSKILIEQGIGFIEYEPWLQFDGDLYIEKTPAVADSSS